MYYLIDKYAPFTEGEGPKKIDDSEFATLSAERDHAASGST
jgi:protein-ribulosamine 3-kinase